VRGAFLLLHYIVGTDTKYYPEVIAKMKGGAKMRNLFERCVSSTLIGARDFLAAPGRRRAALTSANTASLAIGPHVGFDHRRNGHTSCLTLSRLLRLFDPPLKTQVIRLSSPPPPPSSSGGSRGRLKRSVDWHDSAAPRRPGQEHPPANTQDHRPMHPGPYAISDVLHVAVTPS
jgi:hypothetical protein